MKFRSIVPMLILILAVAFAAPANAQITITGPSNGFCLKTPATPGGTFNLDGPFKFVPYGAGQLTSSNCQITDIFFPSGNGIIVDTPATDLLTLTSGIEIVGDGTLKGLLLKIGTGSGGDVDTQVWVLHNGVATQTAFVCHIAGGTATASAPLSCEDSTTIVNVADNDRAFLVVSGTAASVRSGTPADTYGSIRWYLGKQ